MKSLRYLIFGITPFILASCLVAKKYEAPQVVKNDIQFRNQQEVASDSTTLATIAWKDFFTDPTLQSYIRVALTNNLDMKMAVHQIDIATAYVKQGIAGFGPSIGASLSANHQELSQNTKLGSLMNGSTNQFELSANISWEADIWGKIRSQKRAADADFLSTAAAKQAIQTQLVSSIATLYYQLLSIDEKKKIIEETIQNRTKSLQTIQALKQSGSVTEVAVQQMTAQLYMAQDILIDLNQQTQLLENALSILMGEQPHTINRTSLDAQRLTTDLKVGVPSFLLVNRPDVRMAEYQYRSSFEMVNVARAMFYPSLTLTATGGIQSLKIRDLFSVNSLFANLLGGLTQPIFNQRRIRTQYEVSQSKQEIARLNLEKSLLTASREVVDALFTYQATVEKEKIQTKELEAYQKAFDYSQDLLNNGLATYLDVLTAQESTLNTQLTLVGTKLTQLTSMVELYRALGGGGK